MLTQRVNVRLRPFREEDYPRMVEIGVASFPDDPWTVEEARHWDASWDHGRYEYLRLMTEDAAGRAVGYGRINHIPWEFHPQTYYLNVTVDPALRQRGIGSAIYAALLGELQRRGDSSPGSTSRPSTSRGSPARRNVSPLRGSS